MCHQNQVTVQLQHNLHLLYHFAMEEETMSQLLAMDTLTFHSMSLLVAQVLHILSDHYTIKLMVPSPVTLLVTSVFSVMKIMGI